MGFQLKHWLAKYLSVLWLIFYFIYRNKNCELTSSNQMSIIRKQKQIKNAKLNFSFLYFSFPIIKILNYALHLNFWKER